MTRSAPGTGEKRRAGILPREQGAASLDLVIGVMAFLVGLLFPAVPVPEREGGRPPITDTSLGG